MIAGTQVALLTSLAMVAFAANSLLCRLALAPGLIDAPSFATLRVLAGALTLGLIVLPRWRTEYKANTDLVAVAALLGYMICFSYAYLALATGTGALILFGTVQVTMFAGGLLAHEAMPARRWIGAALALAGLAWLLWPAGPVQVSVRHGLFMAAAGVGWGIYSLAGRRADDALQATAANFILATPVGVVIGLALPVGAIDVTSALRMPWALIASRTSSSRS